MKLAGGLPINRDCWHSPTDVRVAPTSGGKAGRAGKFESGSCDRTHLQQDLDGGPFRLLAKPCTTLPKLPAGRAEFPISTIGSEYVVGGQNLPSHIVLYFHAPWALTLELAMTNVKFPRRKFLIWRRALPRYRQCHASLGRKPIRRGRCASLLGFRPAAQTISSRDCSVGTCRSA